MEIRRTSRDPGFLRGELERWLSARTGFTATITEFQETAANGMSSDTVVFDAEWDGVRHGLVARLVPGPGDVPVFPSYDIVGQFRTMKQVEASTAVPVPKPLWVEGDSFLVMEKVEGSVPPDVMPYTFGDNWLFDASADQQDRLQRSTIDVLATLHSVQHPTEVFSHLALPGDPLRSHVDNRRQWYEFVAAQGSRSATIDRAFACLEEHWPSQPGPPTFCWGDARIGNVLYRDFEPTGVLDWEMAGLGPRELDIAWMAYSHSVFHELASDMGLSGMPKFLQLEDLCATYEKLTGYTPRDLGFYTLYAAIQWSTVFLRTGQRAVHFGEREMPEDPDELLYNRTGIERLVSSL